MGVPRRRGRENEQMYNLVCHKDEIIRRWKMSLTPCAFWYVSLKCGGSNFKLYRVWQFTLLGEVSYSAGFRIWMSIFWIHREWPDQQRSICRRWLIHMFHCLLLLASIKAQQIRSLLQTCSNNQRLSAKVLIGRATTSMVEFGRWVKNCPKVQTSNSDDVICASGPLSHIGQG